MSDNRIPQILLNAEFHMVTPRVLAEVIREGRISWKIAHHHIDWGTKPSVIKYDFRDSEEAARYLMELLTAADILQADDTGWSAGPNLAVDKSMEVLPVDYGFTSMFGNPEPLCVMIHSEDVNR